MHEVSEGLRSRIDGENKYNLIISKLTTIYLQNTLILLFKNRPKIPDWAHHRLNPINFLDQNRLIGSYQFVNKK